MKLKHEALTASASPDSKKAQTADGINIEILNEQYKLQIGLYEKYLDLLIKFNIFYFAVTGAILSFYFSHIGSGLIKWSLLLPILMSTFFSFLTVLAYRSLKLINQETIYMADFFGFQPPEVNTLRHALLVNFLTLLIIIGALIIVMVMDNRIKTEFKNEKAREAATTTTEQSGK